MAGQATPNGVTQGRGGSRAVAPMIQELDQALANVERLLAELNGETIEAPEASGQDLPLAPNAPVPAAGGNGTEPVALVPVQPAAVPELDSETLALLTRFVSGALIIGGEGLMARLRYWDDLAAVEAPAGTVDVRLEQASPTALARYWLLGSIAWGRRQAVGAAYRGAEASAGLATYAAQSADRLTSGWLLRPLRRPLQDMLNGMARSANERIQEGREEERLSRWMAAQAIEEMVNLSIDYISENPQLAALVREQLTAQSVGLTTTVVDTSRAFGEAADDVAEAFVRRLLRRARRGAPPQETTPVEPPALPAT